MKPLTRVLVTLSGGPSDEIAVAEGVAICKAFDADLAAIYVDESLRALSILDAEAAAYALDRIRETQDVIRGRVRERMDEARIALGRPADVIEASGDFLHEVTAASALADLLVTVQHDPEHGASEMRAAQDRLIVSSHAPVLVIPYTHRPADWPPSQVTPRQFGHALIAWSERREASLALKAALPLLTRAQKVELVTVTDAEAAVGARLAAVVAYLKRHGIAAEPRVLPRRTSSLAARLVGDYGEEVPVAEMLLSHAADTGADLLVMGAYGRPRAWELIVGGATHTVLRSMTLPVLMMH